MRKRPPEVIGAASEVIHLNVTAMPLLIFPFAGRTAFSFSGKDISEGSDAWGG